MGFFSNRYFDWLQKGTPAEPVEKYPEIDKNGETSVKGIYITGDLTGIPLLKLASESGKEMIDRFADDKNFQKLRGANKDDSVYDIVIIGAGVSGISAGIEAHKKGWKFVILESAEEFTTIVNFPKGKPIYAEPDGYEQKAELKIDDGTKESLLDDLYSQMNEYDLPIKKDYNVKKIERRADYLQVEAKKESFKGLRVILAIGKSGNARKLNVQGEDKGKVFNRVFDPADAEGEKVLVVGGGDSAMETAISTAEYAESITLSYRRSEFSRPKEGNVEGLKKLVDSGKVKLMMETNVKEIKEESVVIVDKEENETEIENTQVYAMIGRELPLKFFRRSGISMEGDMSTLDKLNFLLLILFAGVLYFGKSSADFYKHFFGKLDGWGEVFGQVFNAAFWSKFFSLPVVILSTLFGDSTRIWNVTKYVNAFVAYVSFIAFVLLGIYLLYKFLQRFLPQVSFNWQTFKYAYFIAVGVFFAVVFFGERYFDVLLFGKSMSFYYTGIYSVTILIFGMHRIYRKPTKYIKLQTWALILIQCIPLFILPELLLPLLGKLNALGGNDGFILTQVFPNESYWRSYGFILAWPLNFSNLYNGNITTFWLVFSLAQTFVIIPLLVYRWGKGAYCGWICSCGALAETLGDEYRTLAPHGPKAKKFENFGQWALLAAFLITGVKLLSILYNMEVPVIHERVSYVADFFQKFYYIGIDVIFAGVLGVGVYFFLSGRVWCRFGCPLAALMHIYNRFSCYRIFSEKKKCISCNICTKVCHMGIDVMNYANKGIPMNDVECVRCSACIVNCPTNVLSFGSLPEMDVDNNYHKNNEVPIHEEGDWRRGRE